MRAASPAFGRVVAGSHRIAVRADILLNRSVIAEGVPLVDGRVNFDRSAARLATLSATIADPTRLPLSPSDIYTPFGYEVRIWRGVYVGAAPELLPLGTFPIQSSYIDGVGLATDITGEDRSRLVSDARFEDDYQIAAGTNYATAIQALITDGVTGFEFLFPSTTFTTPLLTFAAQSDRWEAAQGMARSLGNEIFFDGLGRCVMRPEPTFADDPVATIAEGSNMVSAGIELDRTNAYNRVIATSSNASLDAQYRGVATDDDPSSPTYYDGPFGRKPRFYSSPFLASDAQCDSAAAAVLASGLGVASSLSLVAVPDPRYEASDVILARRAALELNHVHIIESFSIGLGPEPPMPITTRARQVAA